MGKTRMVVVAAACGLLVATGSAQTKTATNLLATVDHLVYATPDLKASIDALEKRLGVRAAPGGQHPGRGTRNALIALSPTSYIEIIGPDPEQPKPDLPRQFGIDTLAEGRLVTWAAKSSDLEGTVTRAAGHAVKLGEVLPGSRRRPDGVLLNWRYTNPRVVVARRHRPLLHRLGTHSPSGADGCVRGLAPRSGWRTSRRRTCPADAHRAWTWSPGEEGPVADLDGDH